MAIYEYRCDVCGQVKNVAAAMGEIYVVPNCDNCTIIMSRVWQSNPIHFKGDGWGHQ